MSGEKDKITGRVKQAAGDLTDDEELQEEGELDELAGKVKDAVDDVGDKVRGGIDKLRKKFD
ncbi:MAG: CsbD family protein [Acidimicrobiales bacterium]|nr:CsbD family protein [Acidimicrobiales bacterium]